MRNPVAKHFRKVCRPSIQQSKRRQALMAASVQDEDEHDFNTAFSQRNGDVQLDSEDGLWDDVLSDVSCSSISVNDGDEE
jgi:hypothetical protein